MSVERGAVRPERSRPTDIRPDYTAAVDFLNRWYGEDDLRVLTGINPIRKVPTVTASFRPDQADNMRAWLGEHGAERNIYFSVNPVARAITKKASREDIREVAWLHVDVDPRAGEDLDEEQERALRILREPPAGVPKPTVIVFSGGGYQGFWRLAEALPIEGSLEAAEDAKRFNQQLEVTFGADHCHNIDRIMRVPGTINRPDKRKREKGRTEVQAELVEWNDNEYPADAFVKAPSVEGSSNVEANVASQTVRVSGSIERIDDIDELEGLSEYCKVVIVQGEDPDDPQKWPSRSECLFWVCCEMVRANLSDDVIFSVLTDSDFEISSSVLDKGGRSQKYALRQIARAREKTEDFERDEKGKPRLTPRNIRFAVAKLDVALSHDEFEDRSLINGLDGFGPHIDDNAVNRLWLLIEERFQLRSGKEKFWSIVCDYALRNRFHPVLEYLDSLAWDGQPRLDQALVNYFGSEDTDYTRAVGAIVLIAAVRRVRDPGCKFDEMLVLEGTQGSGKSSALAALAVREEWFTDDLPLGVDTKRFIEATAGRWIVEAGELKGMRHSEVECLKSCLSRRVDRARLSYARLPIERPRQFVIIGTTNSDRYLRDNTGNRRYWPVRTGEIDLERLKGDVAQIWAEAAEREAMGESTRLDPTLYPAAAVEQEARRVEDPFVQMLSDVLRDRSGQIQMEEVWKIVGVPKGQRGQLEAVRLGEAMRELGWQKKRRRYDGQLKYCYVRGEGQRLWVREDEDERVDVVEDDAIC